LAGDFGKDVSAKEEKAAGERRYVILRRRLSYPGSGADSKKKKGKGNR